MHPASEIDAATDLWEHLAARAWGHYRARGRGVLLLARDQLQDAHRALRTGLAVDVEPDYLPATFVPKADDFSVPLNQYDPTRQVMLMIGPSIADGDSPGAGGSGDGSEMLLVLEAKGRPTPEACFDAWRREDA